MLAVRGRNLSAVLFHDPVANRQSQSSRIAASAEPRLENVVNLVRSYAAPGVRELDDDLFDPLFAIRAPCGVSLRPHEDGDAPARGRMANRI
jgi:hypothetical protein